MLDSLFKPKSVAVIGASNRKLTIGYRIIQNLIDSEFNGPIFPVHPKASFIKNLPAYPRIGDVPADVELAHIVVKNTLVPSILADCAQKGVKVAIINTGGFKEIGSEGQKLQDDIVAIAKKTGIRVFGPNCQGIMNSDPEVRAYCNFTFTPMKPGRISLIAQSGGVGEVINNRLFELGAGLRMYASNGNASDISIPEILQYMGDDPETKVIICHVEKLSDPLHFLRVAKEVSKKKPILGMKTGRTMAGAKAVSSHTGGMIKQDTTTELVFQEAGVVSFRDEEDLCQAALAFSWQPVPRGNRVGVITNTGGPGIISTDTVIEGGCQIPDLLPATQKKLKDALFPEAIVSNPVDVIATAGPAQYKAAVSCLLEDDNIDSILVNFITPFFVDCKGVAQEIAALAKDAKKTIVGVVMTQKQGWADTLATFRDAHIPTYDFPEIGAKSLVAMAKYAQMRSLPDAPAQKFSDIRREQAARIIESAKKENRSFVQQVKAFELLSCYGIDAPEAYEVTDMDKAVQAAESIGYPVVVKVESEQVVHKSDSGGVRVNLTDEAALRDAMEKMGAAFKDTRHRYLIGKHVEGGREVIIGAKKEDRLGPVIMFGLGGIFIEVLKDVSFGLAPLSKERAKQMIGSIKGAALLDGVRGEKPVDKERLVDTVCRLSRLVHDHPDILELDLNPVFVYEEGKSPIAVDVRIKIR